MKRGIAIAACIVVTVTATRAHADEPEAMRRVLVDVAAGARGGAGLAADVRAFAGVVVLRGTLGSRNGFASIGMHGATGIVTVKDRRALDGSIAPARTAWGPEARIGLGRMDDGLDAYAWVGGGPIWVHADDISDQLPERGRHVGIRAAIGLAWPGSFRAAFDDDRDDGDDRCDFGSSSGLCAFPIILRLLAPNTFEVTWEHVAGADRVGVGTGYAF